jgi:HAD superfamily hydrolase (TIGR01509 family)
MKTLVLDAMGVIFDAGDDVVELLCPFIHEQGGISDNRQIEALYREASLGQISAREFWARVQVDPGLEDAYLRRHRLSMGFREFIREAKSQVASIWCLSNDVPQWSRKLRDLHDLHDLIDGFVISGEIGARKPDPAIYHALLSRTGVPAENIIFVDDRPKNLAAAAALGFETMLFDPALKWTEHYFVNGFSPLLEYVRNANARQIEAKPR